MKKSLFGLVENIAFIFSIILLFDASLIFFAPFLPYSSQNYLLDFTSENRKEVRPYLAQMEFSTSNTPPHDLENAVSIEYKQVWHKDIYTITYSNKEQFVFYNRASKLGEYIKENGYEKGYNAYLHSYEFVKDLIPFIFACALFIFLLIKRIIRGVRKTISFVKALPD